MLILTTPDGDVLTAPTDVRLADKFATHLFGAGWDNALSPFEEHAIMNEILDDIVELREGPAAGYALIEM